MTGLRGQGWFGRALLLVAASVMMAGVAACGGDAADPVGTPRLAGTPIPTGVRPSPTPPVCDVSAQAAVPETFPDEFPLPEGFVPTAVETSPHLHVEGRVSFDPAAQAVPQSAVERQIVEAIRETWTLRLNSRVEGLQYTFTAEDGREGAFYSLNVLYCPNHADLTYDFLWITPAAGG